jgi:hypothetical protein
VLDALSWAYQTAGGPPSDADLGNVNSGWGQERTQFSDDDIFGLRNSVLVFDPDQAHDGTSGVDGNRAYTSFAEKTYDVSNFDNDTLSITLEWEIRVEARSVNVIEVSFDGGASWLNIFELDANDLSDPALQTRFSDFLAAQFDGGTPDVVDSGDVVRTYQTGPDTITISDFAPAGNVDDSNTMILRIGIVGGDNDWWFAVDDIRVEADPQGFVIGDANGDGEANFSDINAGVAAILGQIYSPEMDVNEDLAVDFSDINGFVNAVLGN